MSLPLAMHEWYAAVSATLQEVNALRIYAPLCTSTTLDGACYVHPVERFGGVRLDANDPSRVRSTLMQAAPIPDTRVLIWAQAGECRLFRRLAIDLGVDPTSSADAVHVTYVFRRQGAWVTLHRFVVLRRFTPPHELLEALRALLPGLHEEEAAWASVDSSA